MAKIALLDHLMGNLGPSDFFKVDMQQRFPGGIMVTGVDQLGVYGKGEYMYLQANVAILANQVCVYNDNFQAIVAPVSPGAGRAMMVAKQDMDVGEWGWFQLSGTMLPVRAAVSVAAGAGVGLTATAGSVGAVTPAGALLGVTSLRASTANRVTTGQTKRNSRELRVASTAGLFVGQAVTGTGIAASTVVTGFGPDDNTVLLNNAMTVTGSAAITFTNTGFIEVAAPHGIIAQAALV